VKVEAIELVKEETITGMRLKFENGISLDITGLTWLGRDGKKEVLNKFEEVVDSIKNGTLELKEE
jgi:hypothetical protein